MQAMKLMNFETKMSFFSMMTSGFSFYLACASGYLSEHESRIPMASSVMSYNGRIRIFEDSVSLNMNLKA